MICPSCGRENIATARFCSYCAHQINVSDAPTLSQNLDIPSTDLRLSQDFVGRRSEIVQLVAAFNEAVAGNGQLVILEGEPGIGKTRLTQEMASLVGDRATVLWGRCYEGEGAPPYWPWIQILRRFVSQHDGEFLELHTGQGAGGISEIVPELLQKIPQIPPSPQLEPEQARFRVFDSITTFLKNVSNHLPLVLILDDLHRADRSSILLLEFLAREIHDSPVLILGTVRDAEVFRQHPLSETMGRLVGERWFDRLPLSGLSRDEVGDFVEISQGEVPSSNFVEEVHARTDGNPLFVGEVVKLAARRGRPDGDGPAIQLPQGVRDAIGERFNHLSDGCVQVLKVASVIGRGFGLPVLRLVASVNLDELMAAIDEALQSRVIENVTEGDEGYQFSHVLFQQTLYEDLPLSQALRLHASVGEALERACMDGLGTYTAEMAHHFGKAETLIGPEKAVGYSLMAGEQAMSSHAYEEAQAHFERGLEFKGQRGTDRYSGDLHFGLARAQRATLPSGHYQQVIETLRTAFDNYIARGEISKAVEVAEFPLELLPGLAGIVDLVNSALELVDPDSIEAGRLLARSIWALCIERSDYQSAEQAVTRSLSIAQRLQNSVLELQVTTNAALVDLYRHHWPDAIEKSLRSIELARNADDPTSEALSHLYVWVAMITSGNLAGARGHAEAMLSSAEKSRNRSLLGDALRVNSTTAEMAGDWQIAREYAQKSLNYDPSNVFLLSSMAVVEFETGRFSDGNELLQRLIDVLDSMPDEPTFAHAAAATLLPKVARVTDDLGNLDVARSAADAILKSPHASPDIWLRANIALGMIAVEQNDVELANRQYFIMSSHEGMLLPAGCMALDYLLALLARTGGDLNSATVHFDNALAFCRDAGFRPELAWSLYDYAAMLTDIEHPTNRSTDRYSIRDKALELITEAHQIASELEMRPLIERIDFLQESSGSDRQTVPEPTDLTRRESEVLRLMVSGKTNREIADELFVSERTVANHLNRIYTKTNTRNRTEAATYASRQGLV